jgi:phage N-6-adenine-methyltransferase
MTPPKILKAWGGEFNFVLDVCASPQSTKCPVWFDEDQDAFKQDWTEVARLGVWKTGGTVAPAGSAPFRPVTAWCNPPYGPYKGKTLVDWIRKGYEESLSGLTVVFLLPANKQDQDWWHALVEPHAETVPAKGRIHFLDPATGQRPIKWSEKRRKFVRDGNSQGSVFVIFGPNYKPRAPRRSFVVPPDELIVPAKRRTKTLLTTP